MRTGEKSTDPLSQGKKVYLLLYSAIHERYIFTKWNLNMKAKKFEGGEDMTDDLDFSKARRINQVPTRLHMAGVEMTGNMEGGTVTNLQPAS
jgi:hypothetical protein